MRVSSGDGEWWAPAAGQLFTMEDTVTGSGLIFLKEAGLPHAGPEKMANDFEFDGAKKGIRLEASGLPLESGPQ